MAELERVVRESERLGLGAFIAEDERTRGRHVRVSGRDLINFGSCSYLGLEVDERLVEGAVRAVRDHGVQFCASRIYMSSPLYAGLQERMEAIFGHPVIVAPTTTLGHLSSMPVLIDPDDAILLDHQVHSSVQMTSRLVATNGTRVEVVPHNDLETLEAKVESLSGRHRQVWYMADGIYSMFGDRAPIVPLAAMLDRQPQMRLFVDDAHGMSWCGPRGAGSVLEHVALHPRMVLATGLGKGFGTGGGVIVLPDEAQRDRIRFTGPTLLFSGPLQPPILGAAIAAADLHLSDEIDTLQAELRARVSFVTEAFRSRDLPLVSPPDSPVGFVATGDIPVCQAMVRRLIDDGFYVNPAQYPAAPYDRSGLRFLVTRHHTQGDLEGLADACARHWEAAVFEAGATPESVTARFGLPVARPGVRPDAPASTAVRTSPPLTVECATPTLTVECETPTLTVECASSIDKLDAAEWDRTAGTRGCLGSAALRVFERVFGPDAGPENRWTFRHYVVRDAKGEAVLATSFTEALWKADMLAPEAVSRAVEARREADPLHLTQRVFAQGSLLSEGDHLWLRDGPEAATSREAIRRLVEAVRIEAESRGAAMTVFRDVPEAAQALASIYQDEGLMRMPGPVAHVLEPVPDDLDAFVATLGRDHRRHHRASVAPFDDAYATEVLRGVEAEEAVPSDRLQDLYERVRARSLALNTFALPETLWSALAASPDGELVLFREKGRPDGPIVGFFAAFDGPAGYVPLVAGLDYDFVASRGLYRQVLRTAIERAGERGAARVLLGFGADLEKRRFGAKPMPGFMFVEITDADALEAIGAIAASATA
ncbi:MAG: aminotransferase class I/II-fold pyridoxal phosphate-dependent enzyme [Myxococcota bacterium]